MSERINKVNALLSATIGPALAREATVPGVLPTVTAVETSPDLRQATVWVSLVPDSDQAWEAVEEAAPAVQAHLASRVELKHTPKLTFSRDRGQAHADKINRLLS